MRSERQQLEASSWFAVVRAYQECNRRYAQMLEHFDLTIPQFDVLTAIRRLPAATPKQIADELVVTRGNISGLLQRLQDRELIATRSHETDGRSFYCELTPTGVSTLERARSAAARFVAKQLSAFSDEELQHTKASMQRMHSHLCELDPDAIARGSTAGSSRSAGHA